MAQSSTSLVTTYWRREITENFDSICQNMEEYLLKGDNKILSKPHFLA